MNHLSKKSLLLICLLVPGFANAVFLFLGLPLVAYPRDCRGAQIPQPRDWDPPIISGSEIPVVFAPLRANVARDSSGSVVSVLPVYPWAIHRPDRRMPPSRDGLHAPATMPRRPRHGGRRRKSRLHRNAKIPENPPAVECPPPRCSGSCFQPALNALRPAAPEQSSAGSNAPTRIRRQVFHQANPINDETKTPVYHWRDHNRRNL